MAEALERTDTGTGQSWSTENVRVTVFTPDMLELPDPQAVFGIEPDLLEIRKGGSSFELAFGPGVVRVEAQPGRVDWIWACRMDMMEEPVRLGPPLDTVNELLSRFERWMPNHDYVRVALGGTFVQPVQGKEDGYALLGKYLTHVKLDPVRISDFSYQFNVPTTADGFSINRLSKWAVRKMTKTVVSGEAPVTAFVMPSGVVVHSDAIVEVDVNSVPEVKFFGKDEALRRILTLRDMLGNLLEHGDDI